MSPGIVVGDKKGTKTRSGTDKAKITRKRSKSDNHGHEERKSTKGAKDSIAKGQKVKPQSNLQSTLGQQKSNTKGQKSQNYTDHADCNPEEDICLIEKLLNNDPFQLPPMDLKQSEMTEAKSSIEEPPELELKDLPSHLEYAFLEENNKLPVIIAKGLKNNEKDALLKVLKSHKRAIAWKITDIKDIDPHFCTYKILMEDDYKPTVQSQIRVNPKIHEVIKKEVLKLLDAGMIYPISDSPWVSPVHCIPKKGGITIVDNEENELIPTQLVTGWRVCIDYRNGSPVHVMHTEIDMDNCCQKTTGTNINLSYNIQVKSMGGH
ncbi:hypothetical protein Tco_1440647 [Tanacetum coccineum]